MYANYHTHTKRCGHAEGEDKEYIEAAIKAVISETGAESMKDMGKVMGVASKQLAGKAEGKAISDIVRRLLS